MQKVNGFLARLALIAFSICYCSLNAVANVCVNPRIHKAEACGFVMDQFGEPIQGAVLIFGLGIDGMPIKTDDSGYFSANKIHSGTFNVEAKSAGCATAFARIESVRKPGRACKRPLYVLLQVGGEGCTMISTKRSDLPIAKRD